MLLYDAESGDMLAMIEGDRLGQMRTGAASGVATKYMSRESSDTLGVYGTGWQAESQMMAVCAVRRIKSAKVYGRDGERRAAFARRMTALLRTEVIAAPSPEEAARGCSIIVTATSAREPVLKGEWVEPGAHLNVVGSNFFSRPKLMFMRFGGLQ